jgi:hypothetical protein
MNRKIWRLALPVLIVPVILLTSCSKIPAGATTTAPSESVSLPVSAAAESPAAEDWNSGVKTDYSGLTDYRLPREIYTRLSEGPLAALNPSGDYGNLLPYVGETMYIGSYSAISMHGLMTADGMIVTDPIYTYVNRAYYYNPTGEDLYLPAYELEITPDNIDEDDPWGSVRHAVCALDGSWITPFDYSDAFFTDKVIILVRDMETNDIDIMDYSGNVLYNIKSLPCYSKLSAWLAYSVFSSYGEGMFVLPLDGSSIAIVDALTGETAFMEYESGIAFSGGLAAVMKNGLYGFIDKSYAQVIEPAYSWVDYFIDGMNVVTLPDNSGAVIDRNGKQLLNSAEMISRWGPDTYCVYTGDNTNRVYDENLNEVTSDNGNPVFYINDGWYYYKTTDGAVILKAGEKHFLPGVQEVSMVFSGLVNYYEYGEVWKSGLKSLDGEDLYPLSEEVVISFAESKNTGDTYFIASTYGEDAAYTVYNRNGTPLFSGKGTIMYNEEFELFEVNDEMSFSYKDFSGHDLFRISLLKYVPD